MIISPSSMSDMPPRGVHQLPGDLIDMQRHHHYHPSRRFSAKAVPAEHPEEVDPAPGLRTAPRHGCVTARAVAETLDDDHSDTSTIADLAELPALVTTDSSLGNALSALVADKGNGLPVLDPPAQALVGWITHQTILIALQPARGATPE